MCSDQAANVRLVIDHTRLMFKDRAGLDEALTYLQAILGLLNAGGGHASITKETLVATGETPVVGLAVGGNLGATNQPQTRMDTSSDPATSAVGRAPIRATFKDEHEADSSK